MLAENVLKDGKVSVFTSNVFYIYFSPFSVGTGTIYDETEVTQQMNKHTWNHFPEILRINPARGMNATDMVIQAGTRKVTHQHVDIYFKNKIEQSVLNQLVKPLTTIPGTLLTS